MPAPFRFEEFDLDLERYELRRSGQAVKLERIPMELLILLLQNNGKLVRRDAINRRLWGENAYQDTDHSVNTAVNKLRYILRDDPRDPRFIQTVVGQGYRFIAEVAADPFSGGCGSPVRAEAANRFQRRGVHPAGTGGNSRRASALAREGRTCGEYRASRSKRRNVPSQPAGRLFLSYWRSLSPCWSQPPSCTCTARVLHTSQKTRSGGFHSIAVLPFVNLAQNSDQDYIVDGMTDQLITDLAGSTPLRVISRRSVMQYKGVQVPMREIAETLDVDAVLEGSFLHNGTQVRITADLIDARNDRHLWAQVYEESGNDLLNIQESVTNDIVREVALALGSGVSTSQVRPVNVEARDSYLRGRFLWNKRTPASLEKSVVYYQNAINADPNYAEAYAALGIAYVVLTGYGSDPSSSLAKAQLAAEAALRLGGGEAEAEAEAHTVLGAVKTERDRDWPGAEVEYRRALAVGPVVSDRTPLVQFAFIPPGKNEGSGNRDPASAGSGSALPHDRHRRRRDCLLGTQSRRSHGAHSRKFWSAILTLRKHTWPKARSLNSNGITSRPWPPIKAVPGSLAATRLTSRPCRATRSPWLVPRNKRGKWQNNWRTSRPTAMFPV